MDEKDKPDFRIIETIYQQREVINNNHISPKIYPYNPLFLEILLYPPVIPSILLSLSAARITGDRILHIYGKISTPSYYTPYHFELKSKVIDIEFLRKSSTYLLK